MSKGATMPESVIPKCVLCGEPMPDGEEMFKFHGFSGNCPKPPLPRPDLPKLAPSSDADWRKYYEDKCRSQRKDIEALETRLATATELVRECKSWIRNASFNEPQPREKLIDRLAAFLEGCR